MTAWPSEFQQSYLGKTVVIALTLIDRDGKVREQMQRHGIIEAIESDGIHIALQGVHEGEEVTLPSDPDAFSPAQPGRYRLEETGEIVSNPDYFSAWEMHEEPMMNGEDSESEFYLPLHDSDGHSSSPSNQNVPRFAQGTVEDDEEEDYEDEDEDEDDDDEDEGEGDEDEEDGDEDQDEDVDEEEENRD